MEREVRVEDLAGLPVNPQVGEVVQLLEVHVVLQLTHQLLHVESGRNLPVDESGLSVPGAETAKKLYGEQLQILTLQPLTRAVTM